MLIGEMYLCSCRRNEVLPNIDSFQVRVNIKYGNSKWRTKPVSCEEGHSTMLLAHIRIFTRLILILKGAPD